MANDLRIMLYIVTSHKGGTGKTTIASAVANYLEDKNNVNEAVGYLIGEKPKEKSIVLYISLDPYNDPPLDKGELCRRESKGTCKCLNLDLQDIHIGFGDGIPFGNTLNINNKNNNLCKIIYILSYNIKEIRRYIVPIISSENYILILMMKRLIEKIIEKIKNSNIQDFRIIIDIPPFIEPAMDFIFDLIRELKQTYKNISLKINYIIDSRVFTDVENYEVTLYRINQLLDIIKFIIYYYNKNISNKNTILNFIFNFIPNNFNVASTDFCNYILPQINSLATSIRKECRKGNKNRNSCNIIGIPYLIPQDSKKILKEIINKTSLLDEILSEVGKRCQL